MLRVLHRVGFTSRLVTDLRVSSYLAFPSLPLRAVFFCCTFLKVAFTGISPAPLPYDARTFLTVFLPRNRPANSQIYDIMKYPIFATILKIKSSWSSLILVLVLIRNRLQALLVSFCPCLHLFCVRNCMDRIIFASNESCDFLCVIFEQVKVCASLVVLN